MLILMSMMTCALVGFASAQATDPATTAQDETTTEFVRGPFNLTIWKENSNVHYLLVKYSIPRGWTAKSYQVFATKIETGVLIRGPEIKETEYTVEDLVMKTHYNVCVHAVIEDEGILPLHVECVDMVTAGAMRFDSIICLVCTILLFVIIIITSIFLSRRKKPQEDEEALTPKENKEENAVQPHSPIEDADIPYITPPLDELDEKDREKYNAVGEKK